MANNITAAGASSFVTASMKVAAGEQLDALHMQNMADNDGHVYFRQSEIPIYNIETSGVDLTAAIRTVYFQKKASHNAIRAVYSSFYNSAGNVTVTLSVHGVPFASTVAQTVSTHSIALDTLYTIEVSTAGLTNDSYYRVSLNFSPDVEGARAGFFQIHTTGATY